MCSRAARMLPAPIDLDGDYLIPGVVDLHTDNLERQVQPRSNARWPSRSAMIAHDAQCAAAGVTTVLDALCLGDLGFDKDRVRTFRDGVADLRRARRGGPAQEPSTSCTCAARCRRPTCSTCSTRWPTIRACA